MLTREEQGRERADTVTNRVGHQSRRVTQTDGSGEKPPSRTQLTPGLQTVVRAPKMEKKPQAKPINPRSLLVTSFFMAHNSLT